jgi:GTPase SAR1 family protein
VSTHNPDTPIILVGTKLDMRESPEALATLKENNVEPVSTEKVFFFFCVLKRLWQPWYSPHAGRKARQGD